jgi:DNA-binding response OmpR family regulator
VLDDEPCIHRIYQEVLERHFGARVYCCADGWEALGWAKRLRPDLILSDFHHFGLNGVEFTSELRRLRMTAPVLIISGNLSPSKIAAVWAAGANGCLAKPFLFTTFLRLVRKLLTRRRHRWNPPRRPGPPGRPPFPTRL